MSGNSDPSNVTRREFLAGAGTFATTGFLVIAGPSSEAEPRSNPANPPDHTMTFDATKDPIACSSVPLQTGPDPCLLTVKIKEVVHWKAITGKDKHRLAVLFIDRTPFVDKDGDKVWAFHGTDSDETGGIGKHASIDPTLSEGDVFEFSIGIWDEKDPTKIRSYTGDPTIMIGKGGSAIASAIAKLKAANGLLLKAAAAYPPESDNIKSIEAKVATLVDKLQELVNKPQGKAK